MAQLHEQRAFEQEATPALRSTVFTELMKIRDRPLPNSDEAMVLHGPTILPSRFFLSETGEQVMSAIGTVLSDISEDAGHGRRPFSFNSRHLEANLVADRFTALRMADGSTVPAPEDPWMAGMRAMTQPWPTADGRYYLPHLNLPHLQARVLNELGAEPTPDSIAAQIAQRNGEELEEAIAQVRATGGLVRTADEWLKHPQGKALSAKPVVKVTRIGDAPPKPLMQGERLLSSLRVLDLTRILAGPITARTLAEQGADVLMITSPHLPQAPQHVRDTSHGKRSAFVDLDTPEGRQTLTGLIEDADVFSQGYRPGALAARGFGPEEMAKARPGIVYVSISCFGLDGPFAGRAGWEQVAQAVTGIAAAMGAPGAPKLIPVPACDYITGYLGAFGALLALARRAVEGGSWHVEVSLCGAAMMLLRQGVLEAEREISPLTESELRAFRVDTPSSYGQLVHLAPVLDMPGAEAYWERPTTKLGEHQPEWIAA